MVTPKGFSLMSVKKLYHENIPPIEYLIDELICEQSLIFIVGPPASFKTGYILYTCLVGACRDNVLGFKVNKKLRTLFIDEENGLRRTKSKLVRLIQGTDIDIDKELNNNEIIFASINGFKIDDSSRNDWITPLKELIKKHSPNLIVIDNIARCMVGSERDEKDVARVQNLLKPLIEKYNVSIVIIHHGRKPDNGHRSPVTLNDIRGSGDFGAQNDETFWLDAAPPYKQGDTKTFMIKQMKRKDGPEMNGFNFTVTGTLDTPLKIEFSGYVKENINTKKEDMKIELLNNLFSTGEEYSKSYIIKYCKDNNLGSKNYVSDVLKQLVKEDFIIEYKKGKDNCYKKQPYIQPITAQKNSVYEV